MVGVRTDPTGGPAVTATRRHRRLAARLLAVASVVALFTVGVTEAATAAEPDLTDAALVVTPSTGLVDRQQITVTARRFDPVTATFGVAQCAADDLAALMVDACDLSTARTTGLAPDGSASVTLLVRRIITTADGREVDCAVAGACVVGAATLESDLFTVIEGTAASISFDPAVPPVPRLTIDLTVDEVTATQASGTVICNREARSGVEIIVEQTRGGSTASAIGFSFEGLRCDTTATPWSVSLRPGRRRLVGGPATFEAFAFAEDGFDAASDQTSGQITLRGGNRKVVASDNPGEFTSISIVGVTGVGANQSVRVEVICGRPSDFAEVSVSLSQYAGRKLVTAHGFADLDGCDGTELVDVPITFADGVLAGGPARAEANVFIEEFSGPGDFFFDFASATDQVKLRGTVRSIVTPPPPNPGSRITISTVTGTSISGVVACEEPVTVGLGAELSQTKGRSTIRDGGFTEIECDGQTPFTIDLEGGAITGRATAVVSGFAFRLVERPEDPFPIFEEVWVDYQSTTVKLSARR